MCTYGKPPGTRAAPAISTRRLPGSALRSAGVVGAGARLGNAGVCGDRSKIHAGIPARRLAPDHRAPPPALRDIHPHNDSTPLACMPSPRAVRGIVGAMWGGTAAYLLLDPTIPRSMTRLSASPITRPRAIQA
jgi:hypothetical protein